MKTNFTITGIFLFIIALTCWMPDSAHAQLPRERAEPDGPVRNVFWATTNIGISTVRTSSANNLNSSVVHTFRGYTRGGLNNFLGMDEGANTRIGLEYGITDRISVGLGRMTYGKTVDMNSQWSILRQTQSGSIPIDVAVKAATGVITLGGLQFEERFNYFFSVMIARKINRLSLQFTPMYAYSNMVEQTWWQGEEHQLFGTGLLAAYELSDRIAVSTEYLPVIGNRNSDTHDALALALNIDSGGHVFQIYFSTSQWHGEQFIMANNMSRFQDGNFHLGFNIHRVFGL